MSAPHRGELSRWGQISLWHLLWRFLRAALAGLLGNRARAFLPVTLVAAVTVGGAQADRDPPGPYVYGVIPYISAIELAHLHAPILAEIQRVLDRPVTFRTTSSLETFAARLKQQAYDIAFIQPYDYHAAVVESGTFLSPAWTGSIGLSSWWFRAALCTACESSGARPWPCRRP